MTLSSGNVLKIVLFYVAIGYSIPGYAALFITIYILSAKRFKNRFKYSFYTLFKVQCILDVCFQFTNAVMFRAAYSTLFNKLINETDVIKTGVFATAGYFIFYYFLFTSSFSVVLIAMNRVTIMVLPKSFRWYWKRHLSHLLIILFLLPIVFTWHIIAGGSFFVEYEDAYVPDHHKIFGIKNSGYTFVVHFVNDTFVLLVNLVIIAFVVINRRKQVEWLELKLFFLTMANFTFQLIRGMYQFNAYFRFCEPCYVSTFLVHPLIVDITTFLNPWCLLATSSAFRRSVKELLPCMKAVSEDRRIHIVTTTDTSHRSIAMK